jgi:type II secretory pathway predicted ATPase ExeA
MQSFYTQTPPFPQHQLPIDTSNLQDFRQLLADTIRSKEDYPIMSLVIGDPGTGKSTALWHCLSEYLVRSHTGNPEVLAFLIRDSSTALRLATDITTRLLIKPKGRTSAALADEALEAIKQNEIKALCFDEVDQLNEQTLELIRYLHDEGKTPIMLVGSPEIKSLLTRHTKFKSRIGSQVTFADLEPHEVYTKLLPSLLYSQWIFDATREEDRIMGEYLWNQVKPSLRYLRHVLRMANESAKKQNRRINFEILQEIIHYVKDELVIR